MATNNAINAPLPLATAKGGTGQDLSSAPPGFVQTDGLGNIDVLDTTGVTDGSTLIYDQSIDSWKTGVSGTVSQIYAGEGLIVGDGQSGNVITNSGTLNLSNPIASYALTQSGSLTINGNDILIPYDISSNLQNILEEVQIVGYLSCNIPFVAYALPAGFPIKISIQTSNYSPNFSTAGTYTTLTSSFVPPALGGTIPVGLTLALGASTPPCTFSIPLSVLTASVTNPVNSISFVIRFSSTPTLTANMQSYASSAIANISTTIDSPLPPIPNPLPEISVGAYIDSTSTGAASLLNSTSVGWGTYGNTPSSSGNTVANAYNGPLIFGFGWVGPSFANDWAKDPSNPTGQNAATTVWIPTAGGTSSVATTLANNTAAAKSAGFPIRLLSFGGEWDYNAGGNSTFNASGITTSNIATLATNLVSVAIQYNCNGIDFDFEMIPTFSSTAGLPTSGSYAYSVGGISATKTFIQDLVDNIRQAYVAYQAAHPIFNNLPFYISAAPQVNTSDTAYPYTSTTDGLCSASIYKIYDNVLGRTSISTTNSAFDFIFPQIYNTPPEYSPLFIKSAWNNIFNAVNASSPSKIYVGYPASAGSAGNASIFHAKYQSSNAYTNPANPSGSGRQYNWTVNQIFDTNSGTNPNNYQLAVDLRDTLQTLKTGAASTYKNFAGVYCWNLTRDYYNWANLGPSEGYPGKFEPGPGTAPYPSVVYPWGDSSTTVGTGVWGKNMRTILAT